MLLVISYHGLLSVRLPDHTCQMKFTSLIVEGFGCKWFRMLPPWSQRNHNFVYTYLMCQNHTSPVQFQNNMFKRVFNNTGWTKFACCWNICYMHLILQMGWNDTIWLWRSTWIYTRKSNRKSKSKLSVILTFASICGISKTTEFIWEFATWCH